MQMAEYWIASQRADAQAAVLCLRITSVAQTYSRSLGAFIRKIHETIKALDDLSLNARICVTASALLLLGFAATATVIRIRT